MYNSSAERNSGARSKKKKQVEVSQLAQDSFAAFKPFINVFDCGIKVLDSPIHVITKEDWRFYNRHKAGERPVYSDGSRFNPYLDIVRNIYGPEHIDRHHEDGQISYYTSGRNGLGLLYLDEDAHQPWQIDEMKGKEVLQTLFPFGYYRPSFRGQNGYVKVRYSSIAEFNEVADQLQTTLKRVFLHLEVLCDIEVKGTITNNGNSGRLAKLPFTSKFPCHKRDENDSWNYPQLEKFKECPIVSVRRIKSIAEQLETLIDEEKVSRCRETKKRLAEQQKIVTAVVRSQKTRIAKRSTPKAVTVPVSVRPAISVPISDVKSTPQSGHGKGDAFVRNQKDLLPFVRDFYKRHRQFPNVEHALIHLRDKGLFSGRWEDNECRRAKRVGHILNFVSQSFDPNLLGSSESQPVSMSVGKFSWWVRDKFGSKITGQVVDLRRFDPVTMMAPTQKVSVPAKFIETFLVVADFCLNQDPLDNKAVPTSRMKKLWSMVAGGASWNQRYFQIVRNRLDRLGVVRIFDRNHQTGKAWRWEAGANFPAGSWKEEQHRFKERYRKQRVGKTYEEFIADTTNVLNNKQHNTLYQTDTHFLGFSAPNADSRPPPDW